MADQRQIKVLSTSIDTVPRKDGTGTFSKLMIIGENNEQYSKIINEGEFIPNVGDTLDLLIQEVKFNGKKINNILSMKNKTGEGTIMSKTTNNTNTTTTNTDEDKFFAIKGTLFYSHFREPNTKGEYPSNKYQVDLAINEKTTEELEARGIQIKNKGDDKGNFVTLKANKQPRVFSPEGKQYEDIPLVGNGSTGIIHVHIYPNREANVKAGKGGKNCLGFYKVELETLIPYESKQTKILGQ